MEREDGAMPDPPAAAPGQLETEATKQPTKQGPFKQWGHLEILEEVGRGAFGVVYLARDAGLQKEVAPKILYVEDSRTFSLTPALTWKHVGWVAFVIPMWLQFAEWRNTTVQWAFGWRSSAANSSEEEEGCITFVTLESWDSISDLNISCCHGRNK